MTSIECAHSILGKMGRISSYRLLHSDKTAPAYILISPILQHCKPICACAWEDLPSGKKLWERGDCPGRFQGLVTEQGTEWLLPWA